MKKIFNIQILHYKITPQDGSKQREGNGHGTPRIYI